MLCYVANLYPSFVCLHNPSAVLKSGRQCKSKHNSQGTSYVPDATFITCQQLSFYRTIHLCRTVRCRYKAGLHRVLEPLTRPTPGVPVIAPTEPWESLLGYVSTQEVRSRHHTHPLQPTPLPSPPPVHESTLPRLHAHLKVCTN